MVEGFFFFSIVLFFLLIEQDKSKEIKADILLTYYIILDLIGQIVL